MWCFLLVTSKSGQVFECLTHFNRPWAPNPIRFLAQNCFGNKSIIRGYRPLFYHVYNQGDSLKTPLCTKIQKLQKKDESPTGGDAYATDLCKPSKDSWSIVACTEKNVLRFGFEFFGGCREDMGIFCFFYYDFIARTMSRIFGSKLDWILGCDMNL